MLDDLTTIQERLRRSDAEITALRDQLAERDRRIEDLMQKLETLHFRVSQMSRRMYAATSERVSPGQLLLDLAWAIPAGTPAPAADDHRVDGDEDDPPPTGTEGARTRRRGGKSKGQGRLALPKHLDVVEERIDPPRNALVDADGRPLVQLTEEVTEKLDYRAGGFVLRRIIRPVYGRPWCSDTPRIQAPAPACLVPGGKPTDQLVCQVLVAKYADHLPLYRQQAIARRQGVELPRSTLMDWVRSACTTLGPLADALRAEVLAAPLLHADDTPVRRLDPGAGRCATARMWIYRSATAAWFQFTADRRGIHPQNVLEDYRGFLVADAYGGFDRVFAAGRTVEIACWAHARRKFFDAHDDGDPRGTQALGLIRQLYAIERDLADHPPDQRRDERQRRSRPIIAELRHHLDRWVQVVRPNEPLAKAITYATNQWDALTRYTDHGIAPIDNNPAENALRPVALGRKNWMFAGSDDGGIWAATAYTVIQSALIAGLDPHRYLLDVTACLLTPGADPATLTPQAWKRHQIAAA